MRFDDVQSGRQTFTRADQIDDIQQGCSEEQQCSEEEMGS